MQLCQGESSSIVKLTSMSSEHQLEVSFTNSSMEITLTNGKMNVFTSNFRHRGVNGPIGWKCPTEMW